MDRYEETFETWNKLANLYQEKFMHLDIYNDTYDFICDNLATRGAGLLEIGCGPGNITKYILSKRPDLVITGIDTAPGMIELAAKNNPDTLFKIMDARRIGSLQDRYDGIIGGFVLPYLSHADSLALIREANGILKDDGWIYLSYVEGSAENSGYRLSSGGDRCYFYYYEKEALSRDLHASGFELLQTFSIEYKLSATENETHSILIARKKQAG